MSLRLFVDTPLTEGREFALPENAARHAQVRRVQPGDELLLFDGLGMDWPAQVLAMGRRDVQVRTGAPRAVARELPWPVTLAVGMPANERMDALVEKATELGAARIQPLLCERAVLRPEGERAARRREHWQAVAVAAAEQCGRARVPDVRPILSLAAWLAGDAIDGTRVLLSAPTAATEPPAPPVRALLAAPGAVTALSGPEGGLTAAEHAQAVAAGFAPASLGPRVLRADTAGVALLAWLSLQA